MKHLLMISCSNKKDVQAGLLPAIDRYKGAWYGVINKLRKEHKFPRNLDIVIISAKYGLIDSDEKIEYYDQKMDIQRAKELNNSVLTRFREIISKNQYKTLAINLGSDYMESIHGIEKLIPRTTQVVILKGKIGERKRDMKRWIEAIE